MISKSDIASYQKARGVFEGRLYSSVKQEVFRVIDQAIKRAVISGSNDDIVLTYHDVLAYIQIRDVNEELDELLQDVTVFAKKNDVVGRAITVSADGVQTMAQETLAQLHDDKALARMITTAVSEYIHKTDISASGSEFANGANISRLTGSSEIMTIRLGMA